MSPVYNLFIASHLRSSQSCNSLSVTNLEILTGTPEVLMMPRADSFVCSLSND